VHLPPPVGVNAHGHGGDGRAEVKCTPLSMRVAGGRGIVDSKSARTPGSATSYGLITGIAGAERAEWPRPYSRVVASARGRQESHDRPVRHRDDRPDRGHRLHSLAVAAPVTQVIMLEGNGEYVQTARMGDVARGGAGADR
jgi:hypothetical protein